MKDALSLAAGAARVELAPATGGAIARVKYRDVDVLRPTPPGSREVRAHACFPLVPYSNRIAHAQLDFADRSHTLHRNFGDHPHAIHGVGWERPWDVVAHDAASALIEVSHDATGAAARRWPWPFRATQAFTLSADAAGAALTAKLTLINTGDTPFPFGLGFHPFFPRTPATMLGFRADAIWETDATHLPTRAVPIDAARRFDPPRAIDAIALDHVYTGWDGTATLTSPEHGLAVTIAADRAAAFLVVYVPPDGDFLAVEPVTHMTDAFNRAHRGATATGTRTLPPGAAFSCTMRLSVCELP